jgi:hypothetical protein
VWAEWDTKLHQNFGATSWQGKMRIINIVLCSTGQDTGQERRKAHEEKAERKETFLRLNLEKVVESWKR